MVNIKSEYKEELDAIWQKYIDVDDVVERGYGVHESIIKDSILFIGINPSYSKKYNITDKDPYFINLNQEAKTRPEGGVYHYFKKFVDITNYLNETRGLDLKWSHWDLLFYRETAQKHIGKIAKTERGQEFLKAQLNLSKRIIASSEPKIIVVANARARHLMKNKKSRFYMGYKFEFDEQIGTYRIIDSTLNNVPIFFTSPLSGQRTLDNGSYERLKWHIGFVLDQLGME